MVLWIIFVLRHGDMIIREKYSVYTLHSMPAIFARSTGKWAVSRAKSPQCANQMNR